MSVFKFFLCSKKSSKNSKIASGRNNIDPKAMNLNGIGESQRDEDN